MTQPEQGTPTVYLLHGEDELAVGEFIERIQAKLDEGSSAQLDIQHLAGNATGLGDLEQACLSVPFLAQRRLVVLHDPSLAFGKGKKLERFMALLEDLPQSTALVLVAHRDLDADHRRKKPAHPILKWALDHPRNAFVRKFTKPKGAAFISWIEERCQDLGGSIEPRAAHLLSDSVAEEPLLAQQELVKLLDYVDRSRPITSQDVEKLTPFHGQSNVFAMVDAIGGRKGRLALEHLHRLLEDDSPMMAFSMVVRQFRLMIQARESLDRGQDPRTVLRLPPFVIEKINTQARNFSLTQLESIYHQLLEMDVAAKTGKMDLEVALDALVAELAA